MNNLEQKLQKAMTPTIKKIIDIFESKGKEIYCVGGFVRDVLLDRQPQDCDFSTIARPDEVEELSRAEGIKTLDTGKKHGTIGLVMDKMVYEVTTYRKEGAYSNHRYPETVIFAQTLAEDLERRDFTINALAWNPKEGIQDLQGGLIDLEKKQIRSIGMANDRFQEDALRMLRGIRLAAQLDFKIHSQTQQAIFKNWNLLSYLSIERIKTETDLLLQVPEIDYILTSYSGLSQYLGWEGSEIKWKQACKGLSKFQNTYVTRVVAIILEYGQEKAWNTKKIQDYALQYFKKMKASNKDIEKAKHLIYWTEHSFIKKTNYEYKLLLIQVGKNKIKDVIKFKKTSLQQGKIKIKESMQELEKIEAKIKTLLQEDICYTVEDLAIDGNTIQSLLNMPPSPLIGEYLKDLWQETLKGKLKNTPTDLIEHVKKRKEANYE